MNFQKYTSTAGVEAPLQSVLSVNVFTQFLARGTTRLSDSQSQWSRHALVRSGSRVTPAANETSADLGLYGCVNYCSVVKVDFGAQ